MPTTLQTFSPDTLQPSMFPHDERTMAWNFGASLTLAKGTVLAKKASDGKLYAYVDATTAVSAAVGILKQSIKTDASGNVFFSTSSATAAIDNPPALTAPVAVHGTYRTSDLTGYDAAALVDLKGRTLPNGDIQF
jgi:hypothetical protein